VLPSRLRRKRCPQWPNARRAVESCPQFSWYSRCQVSNVVRRPEQHPWRSPRKLIPSSRQHERVGATSPNVFPHTPIAVPVQSGGRRPPISGVEEAPAQNHATTRVAAKLIRKKLLFGSSGSRCITWQSLLQFGFLLIQASELRQAAVAPPLVFSNLHAINHKILCLDAAFNHPSRAALHLLVHRSRQHLRPKQEMENSDEKARSSRLFTALSF